MKARRGHQRQNWKLFLAKLHAVWYCAESKKFVWLGALSHCFRSDSAQFQTARTPTPHSVRQFWIFGHFNFPTRSSVILRRVGLGAVWYCAESDSAQCDTVRSLTRRMQYHIARNYVFCEYLCENKFLSETILDCLSGTQVGWSNGKKCQKILWHCLFKVTLFLTISWTF